LADAKWFILHRATENCLYPFSAKGWHNEEPRNQNEVVHFILITEAAAFLSDIGWGLYSLYYFILCNTSFGHSVLVVNEDLQSSGWKHNASVVAVQIVKDVAGYSISIAEAYNRQNIHFFR